MNKTKLIISGVLLGAAFVLGGAFAPAHSSKADTVCTPGDHNTTSCSSNDYCGYNLDGSVTPCPKPATDPTPTSDPAKATADPATTPDTPVNTGSDTTQNCH